MWRRVTAFLIVCCLALASAGLADAASKKKKTKKAPAAPAISKPIYEAPMRVVIVRSSSPSCEPLCPEWIAAEGEITGATPAAFSKVFKQMGKRKLPVIIRSPGGSINAALEIGRMIRKRGLDVSLGWTSFTGCAPDQKSCKLPPEQKGVYRGLVLSSRAFCNSACPLILAGGVTRLAPSDTYVGVHQPKTVWTREIVTYRERYRMVKGKKKVIDRKIVGRKPGKSRVTYGHDKALRKKLTAYYREMGVDPKILDEAEKTKYKDIDYLTPAEVNQFHLRTLPTGPETLAGPKVCSVTPVPGNCAASMPASKAQAANTPEMPMVFTLVRNSTPKCEPVCPEWIQANGRIVEGTAKKFEQFLLKSRREHKVVILESMGGEPFAAKDLGRAIRNAKLDTLSGLNSVSSCSPDDAACKVKSLRALPKPSNRTSQCRAECMLVFAAGVERIVESGTRLVLSGISRLARGPSSPDWKDSSVIYLQQMGTTNLFIEPLAVKSHKEYVEMDDTSVRGGNLATWIVPSIAAYFSETSCRDKDYSRYCIKK